MHLPRTWAVTQYKYDQLNFTLLLHYIHFKLFFKQILHEFYFNYYILFHYTDVAKR